MSNLRREYNDHKKHQDEVITEAAIQWLDANVIIINEKINRNSVNRLVSSIAKFEETFSPFEQKVPSITAIIDGVEENLQQVLMGKAGDKRTSEVLEYLSFTYNMFSSFFSKDLPVILKAKLFKIAKENPEIRLDSLTRGGFNADAAMKSFAHGITPSPEEMKLIGKVLKSKSIPNIDAKQIASELMSLSYNDLVELTAVSKVPLATTPKTIDDEDVVVSEHHFLAEARSLLTEASSEEIGKKLDLLKTIISKVNIPDLTKAVTELHGKLIAFQSSDAGQKLQQTIQQASQTKEQGGALADIFKTPGGKLLKQANMAIELFNAIGQAWPKVRSLIDKANPTPEDLTNAQKIVTKAVSGGFLKKAAQAGGLTTQPFPGLDPATVVSLLSQGPTVSEQVIREQDEGAQTNPSLAPPAPDAAKTDADASAVKGLQSLKTAMTALNQFATKSSAMPTTATKPNADTTGANADNTGPSGNTSTTATADNKDKPLVQNQGPTNQIVVDAMKSMGAVKDSTKNTLMQAIAAIEKAGYKITK